MAKKEEPQPWSKDQMYCIDVLAQLMGGEHHLRKLAPFGVGVCIQHDGDLATFDMGLMREMVVLAHQHAVRISVSGLPGPRRRLQIEAFRRHHEKAGESLRTWEMHPDLGNLIRRCHDALRPVELVRQRGADDSFRCCLSMVTGFHYDQVPQLIPGNDGFGLQLEKWLNVNGFGVVIPSTGCHVVSGGIPVIAHGAAAHGERHSVVVLQNKVLDPHSSELGLSRTDARYIVVRL